MHRTLTRLAVGMLATVAAVQAQEPVWYSVDLANAAHHEARITVTFPDLPEAGTLELRMSRSSPGRYALHEFGKNVYGLTAEDGMGRSLGVERPDPYQWNVAHPPGDVTVSYTLFADRGSGTYSGIDRTQAHLSVPATFLWARGQENRPIRVDFRPPEASRWQVATQLVAGSSAYSFTAPNLYYFMDSPIHLGTIQFREWSAGTGTGRTFRLAIDHDGTDAEVDAFADRIRTIVGVERDVYGEYAPFDFGEYTFIAAYRPWLAGDGMEHRNSTSLTSTGSLRANPLDLLGTVAHEFFHSWNVERMRPASLEPFDFERVNMSRELWFAEGFTSYYTDLVLRRAGFIDDAEYASRIGQTISTVTVSPGRQFRSPVEMSMYAPFVDRAVSVDPTNQDNTFISYYTWGSALGLALDLELRHRFGAAGLSLDAFMRAAWQRFGVPETPYTVEELQALLGDLTGDPAWARQFFDDYVRGREVADYGTLLQDAGMVLRPRNPEGPWVGSVYLADGAEGVEVASYTLIGSPLYEAGLDMGDRIVSVDGERVLTAARFRELWRDKSPDDTMEITYASRGQTVNTTLTVGTDPRLEVVLRERLDETLSPAARRFRAAWLDRSRRR